MCLLPESHKWKIVGLDLNSDYHAILTLQNEKYQLYLNKMERTLTKHNNNSVSIQDINEQSIPFFCLKGGIHIDLHG